MRPFLRQLMRALCVKNMNSEEIDSQLKEFNSSQKIMFLLTYGHQLTIMAREAYEFQSPGVSNPRLLRDINEILHRVFQAIKEIEANSEECFSLSGISHWIYCADRSIDIQQASIQAYKRALEYCNT